MKFWSLIKVLIKKNVYLLINLFQEVKYFMLYLFILAIFMFLFLGYVLLNPEKF